MEIKIYKGTDITIILTDTEARELSKKLEDPDIAYIRLANNLEIKIAG